MLIKVKSKKTGKVYTIDKSSMNDRFISLEKEDKEVVQTKEEKRTRKTK